MDYCPKCGDLLRDRDDKKFCPKCNGIDTLNDKYFKIEIFEEDSKDSFMDKLNDVIHFGGTALFESFNVVRSSTSHSLPHTSSTTETYHILVAFEDKMHYENYMKLVKAEKLQFKEIGKNKYEVRYPPTVEDPSPEISYIKY